MRSEHDSVQLTTLRSQTESVLREAIGDASDVAILDAPNQRNVGDSLIWEGELEYLRRIGKRIRYVSDLNGFDAQVLRRRLSMGGVVLLHGGGNFGDLWLGHQAHRERVVSELTDFKIVQLSQSIYFENESRAATANEVLSRHPDFVALIRDSLSVERARTILPDVRVVFCPDMALGFEPSPLQAGESSERSVLVIARADREAASGLHEIPDDWASPAQMNVTDWGHHARDTLPWRIARRVAWFQHKLAGARRRLPIPVPALPQKIHQWAISTINHENVQSALKLYSSADVIVVDRLHAHVLAALLGIEHVLLDNNYRKLGGVYDDYSGMFISARYCTSLINAQVEVKRLVEK